MKNKIDAEPDKMNSMNRKIGVGVIWNMLNLFVSRGASTIFLLFLAKFLAPDAFGLIAMATVVFELAGAFITSGLGAALIRSKTVSDNDLNTVFFTNLGLSIIAYLFLYIGAPFIADFYKQTELTSVIRVMGLVVFINASNVVQSAIFTRAMKFKSLMKAKSTGVIFSGVLAVAAAWYGLGVWSLVIQMLSASLITAVVLWTISSWKPSFVYSTESFNRLFGFGRNLLAEGLMNVLYQNSYVLVIGRFFSAEAAGLYFLARKISKLVSQQLTDAVQSATFPALSTLQDDNKTLLHKYRQIMQLMMFFIAPIMGMLAALSPLIFELLFDERWSGAVPYLQLLCIVGALYPLHALNINLMNVKGRSDLVVKVGLIKKAVNLTLLFLAIPYGVFAIVLSQVIGTFLAVIPNTYFSVKLVGYCLSDQVRDVFKPLFAASVSAVVIFLISVLEFDYLIAKLSISVICGVVIYFGISALVKAEGVSMILNKFLANYKDRSSSS